MSFARGAASPGEAPCDNRNPKLIYIVINQVMYYIQHMYDFN